VEITSIVFDQRFGNRIVGSIGSIAYEQNFFHESVIVNETPYNSANHQCYALGGSLLFLVLNSGVCSNHSA